MTNRRTVLMAVGGLLGLLIVAGAGLLIAFGISEQREREAAASNLQALLNQPTVAPTAVMTSTPTPITPTATPVDLSAGYSITVAEGFPSEMIADGRSTTTLMLQTFSEELAEAPVAFLAKGGGEVNPPNFSLPPVGESRAVIYTAGSSPSEISVEAIVNYQGRNLVNDVRLQLLAEELHLDVNYMGTDANGNIPISVRLHAGNDSPISGIYRVALQSIERNGNFYQNGQVVSEVVIDPMQMGSSTVQVIFVPTRGERDTLTVGVVGRRDVPSFRDVVYWGATADDIRIYRPVAGTTRNTPILWYTRTLENSMCVETTRTGIGNIAPRMLRLQYETLLAPDPSSSRFLLESRPIAPDEVVTSEQSSYTGEPMFNLAANASCFSPQFAPDALGGLVNITIQPTFPVYYDMQQVIISYGTTRSVYPNSTVALFSNNQTAATFPLNPMDAMPTMYLINPNNRTDHIFAFWLENRFLNRETQTISVPAGQQALIVPNIQQNTRLPLFGVNDEGITVSDVYIPAAESFGETDLALVYALGQLQPVPPTPTPRPPEDAASAGEAVPEEAPPPADG